MISYLMQQLNEAGMKGLPSTLDVEKFTEVRTEQLGI